MFQAQSLEKFYLLIGIMLVCQEVTFSHQSCKTVLRIHSMPFIILGPLAMRKDKFLSLGASAILEMMAYKKVEDKQFCS